MKAFSILLAFGVCFGGSYIAVLFLGGIVGGNEYRTIANPNYGNYEVGYSDGLMYDTDIDNNPTTQMRIKSNFIQRNEYLLSLILAIIVMLVLHKKGFFD